MNQILMPDLFTPLGDGGIRDKNHGLVPASKAALFFYGDEGNPFLAPRGLHTVNGKLIVADTAQNRIFYLE